MLSIYEEMFLLALDEEQGYILPQVKRNLAFGLAGAILAELALQGKISANTKHRLEVSDTKVDGSSLLDEALQAIQSSEKPRKLVFWVGQLSVQPRKQRERIGEGLASRNLLVQEDRLFYRPPAASAAEAEAGKQSETLPPKYKMKQGLRAMILANSKSNARSVALLSVLRASGLLNLVFTLDELAAAQREIKERLVRASLADPAMLVIEEIEQAVTLALEDAD